MRFEVFLGKGFRLNTNRWPLQHNATGMVTFGVMVLFGAGLHDSPRVRGTDSLEDKAPDLAQSVGLEGINPDSFEAQLQKPLER